MSKVFVQNGYKCATNGRIAVRVKCDEPNTEGRFPDLKVCFDAEYKEIETTQIAEPVKEGSCCDMCDDGKIFYYQQCDSCKGSGNCQCTCVVRHDCGDCDGEGKTVRKKETCIYCDGDNGGFQEQKIGGAFYKGHFLKVAYQELPNLTAVGINDGKMLLLKFDGGDCALMSFIKT